MRENYNNIINDLIGMMMLMDASNKIKTAQDHVKDEESQVSKSKLDFNSAQHVKAFLKSLPKDLRKMFTPTTEDELMQLEIRLIRFKKKEAERDQVREIQKRFGLPLRPNQSLERVAIFARLAMKKQRKSKDSGYDDSNYKDPPENGGPFPR